MNIVNLEEEKSYKDVIVRQSHALVRSKVNLPIRARKLLYLLLHKIDPLSSRDIEEAVSIDAEVWAKYTGSKNPYRDLKCAVDDLYDGDFTFHPDFKNDPEQTLYKRIITGKHYFPRQAKIQVYFDKTIHAHITNLIDFAHTRTQLKHVVNFNSIYAMDLYDLISQFRDKGILRIHLIDLRYALNVEKKYKDIRAFKKHCIDTPLDTIKKETKMNISYSSMKAGRKITGFEFKFSPF